MDTILLAGLTAQALRCPRKRGHSTFFVDLGVDDHEKERVDGMDAIDPFVLERLRSRSD